MSEDLYHHGIKGMKWGVRHTPEQLGHRSQKKSSGDDSHEDYKKAHNSKSISKMSDAELRSRLNRLNMEQQYSRLNPDRVSRGQKILSSTLKVAGTVAAASSTVITLKNNYGTISGWFKNS